MAVTFIKKAPVEPVEARTNWGLEIKRIREQQGLSQRGLAKLAQVNRSSLRRFESCSDSGTLSLLERLADVLGYEMDLMFRGFDRGGLTAEPQRPKTVAR